MTTVEDKLRAALHDQARALRVPKRPALDDQYVEPASAPRARRLVAVAACLALVVAGVVALAVRQAEDPEPRPPAVPVVPATSTSLPGVTPSTAPPSTASADVDVTELLSGFIAARIAGESAQQYLDVPEADVPLLYTTSSGAGYERAEFDQVSGIEWPYELTAIKIRLFSGETVVEQLFFASAQSGGGLGYESDGYGTGIAPTTEDGQPVAVPVNFYDGEVVLQAPHPWVFWEYPFGPLGRLVPEGDGVGPTTDGGQRIGWNTFMGMADPGVDGAGCQSSSPATAEALAESIRAYPGLEATDPVALTIGGTEALMMDLTIAAGERMTVAVDEQGNLCERGVLNPLFDQSEVRAVFDPARPTVVIDGLVEGRATGERMRLYLFDMPEGASMWTLAFAIVAPASSFERAVTTAAPIVASFQFNAP